MLAFRVLVIADLVGQAAGNVRTEDAVPKGERVFESLDAWTEALPGVDPAAVASVDFSRSRVIGIFLGAKGPGHSIRIDDITYTEERAEATVRYTIVLPNPARVYPTVVVYPSLVAEIERRPGRVVFVHTEIADRN